MTTMYSLVNAPLLARDLTRHPRGAAVAADLLRALALGEQALAELDRCRVASDAVTRRAAVTDRMSLEPRALQVLAAARDVASTSGLTAWTAAADVLDSAPMGGLVDLVGFVRDDLLDLAWARGDGVSVARWPTAVDVVSDGITATYAVDICGSLVAPLGRPWRRWLNESKHARARIDGPAAEVLARLAGVRPERLATAGEALRRQRADGWSWPAAMHEACWAVHLTGRERVALAAQLHAVCAVRTATGVERPAPDAVAAVVAAVHATVVRDVLAADVVAALTAPLDTAVN